MLKTTVFLLQRLRQRRSKHFKEKVMEHTKVNEAKIPCIDLTTPSPRRSSLSPFDNALDQPKASCRESREPTTTSRKSKPDQSQKPVSKRVVIKRKHVESTSRIESTAITKVNPLWS